MTLVENVPAASLQEQIAEFKVQLSQMLPPATFAGLEHHIATLIASGIAEKGLKTGVAAPDFTLPDVHGAAVTLSDLRASGPVVLTFYRGEWCPFCNLQLRAYQNILPEIQALGATLVAVSPQTPDHSLSMVEKQGLAFPVLTDSGNRVARQYGLVFTTDEAFRPIYQRIGADLPAFNGDSSWELPMPATFIIAPDGIVRLASVDADYMRRLEADAILTGLRGLATGR